MNIQEYILSGIIESYVLGLASPPEREEFEKHCERYPELREARDAFERKIEEQAMQNVLQSPTRIKGNVFSRIDMDREGLSDENPHQQSRPLAQIRVVWPRYVAAAALILLAASTALNFYFFSKYKEYISKYNDLVTGQNQTLPLSQSIQAKMRDYESALDLIRDPSMAIVKMPGVPTSPNPSSMATVYWDTKTKDVYLLVNSLPVPAIDKQYQLWAMVDGKPVDAGMLDMANSLPIVKMKNIPQAQAFAITLEKKGGSPSPTMEAMYVMGKVTG